MSAKLKSIERQLKEVSLFLFDSFIEFERGLTDLIVFATSEEDRGAKDSDPEKSHGSNQSKGDVASERSSEAQHDEKSSEADGSTTLSSPPPGPPAASSPSDVSGAEDEYGDGYPHPVFGQPLQSLYSKEVPVHYLFRQSIRYLREGLDTKGLFRIPASQDEMEVYKSLLDSGQPLRYQHDEYRLAAGMIKAFIRALPEPLIPKLADAQVPFIIEEHKKSGDTNIAPLLEELKVVLGALPAANYALFHALIRLLTEVASHAHKNLMTVDNLIKCIVPTVGCSPALFYYTMTRYESFFDDGSPGTPILDEDLPKSAAAELQSEELDISAASTSRDENAGSTEPGPGGESPDGGTELNGADTSTAEGEDGISSSPRGKVGSPSKKPKLTKEMKKEEKLHKKEEKERLKLERKRKEEEEKDRKRKEKEKEAAEKEKAKVKSTPKKEEKKEEVTVSEEHDEKKGKKEKEKEKEKEKKKGNSSPRAVESEDTRDIKEKGKKEKKEKDKDKERETQKEKVAEKVSDKEKEKIKSKGEEKEKENVKLSEVKDKEKEKIKSKDKLLHSEKSEKEKDREKKEGKEKEKKQKK